MQIGLPSDHRILTVLKDLPVLVSANNEGITVWAFKEVEDTDDIGMRDDTTDDDPIASFVRAAADTGEPDVREPRPVNRVLVLNRVSQVDGEVDAADVGVFLAHGLHGKLVLCLVYGGVLAGLSFAYVEGEVSNMVAEFRIMDVKSATAVLAVRRVHSCLDVVVRHRTGGLSLFMGRNRLCSVLLEEGAEVVQGVERGRVIEGVGAQFSVLTVGGVAVRYSLEHVTFKSPLVNRCLGAVTFVFEKRGILLRIATLYHEILASCGERGAGDCDWEMFENVLLRGSGHERRVEIDQVEMDDREEGDVADKYWAALLQSEYHRSRNLLRTRGPSRDSSYVQDNEVSDAGDVKSADVETLRHVLRALHFIYEDQKLSALTANASERLARLNLRLARTTGAVNFIDHYRRDYGSLEMFGEVGLLPTVTVDHGPAPSLMSYLAQLAGGDLKTRGSYELLTPDELSKTQPLSLVASWRGQSPALTSARIVKYYNCLFGEEKEHVGYLERAEAVLCAMVDDDFSVVDLESLPFGVALPLEDALYACRQHPKTSWSFGAFVLIGREDLFRFDDIDLAKTSSNRWDRDAVGENRALLQIQAAAASLMQPEDSSLLDRPNNMHISGEFANGKTNLDTGGDGCDLHGHLYQLRFSMDRRLAEVRRILRSTDPIVMTLPTSPNTETTADFDAASEQKRKLERLIRKRYAAPVGRGAFTLRTFAPSDPTKPLPVPKICTTGVLFGQKGSRVTLTETELMGVGWGEFHNGVAAGLRIMAATDDKQTENGQILTRSWIVNHRSSEASNGATHAGMLLALGLGGYLPALRTTDYYEYLLPRHELTSIGLMLGLALGNLGSMEERITKMLCLHIKYFNAPGFAIPDFTVPINVQTAAIFGLGFLYQGSCEHVILDGLFAELGRRSHPGDNIDDREGLSLAAGISIGLVCLGTGSAAFDISDRRMIDRLVLFANGGSEENLEAFPCHFDSLSVKSDLTHSQERRSAVQTDSEASRIKERSFVNMDIVSPGALFALCLTYLRTGDRRMADRINVPDTLYSLDRARPDHIFLRVLTRSLILWNDIQPTEGWVLQTLPSLLRPLIKTDERNMFDLGGKITIDGAYCEQAIDVAGILHARSFAIAGACTAIALKYAGSSDASVISLLTNACDAFEVALVQEEKDNVPVTWVTLTCLSSLALAIAIVAAGSGNLEVFRLLRKLRKRRGKPSQEGRYGYHLALHMAIGFLFLSGGCQTFGTSNTAIAGLLCAIYPRFPVDVNDNQFHLQALRHLYVLATEPRYIETRDVDTGLPCCVDVEIQLANRSALKTRAPCIVPESQYISRVTVVSERYWSKTVTINPAVPGKGWYSNTKGQILFVKRRAGHLPYSSDPKGSKGLLARSLCRPRPSTDASVYFNQVEHLVRAFSADAEVLAFVKYFCSPSGREGARNENTIIPNEQTRKRVEMLYECLSNDQPETVRMYMNADLATSALIQGHASASSIGSLMIVSNYVLSSQGSTTPLVQPSYLSRLMYAVQDITEYGELQRALLKYVWSGGKVWPSADQKGKSGRNLGVDLGIVLQLRGVPAPRELGSLTAALKQAIRLNKDGAESWLYFSGANIGACCTLAVESVLNALAQEGVTDSTVNSAGMS